MGSKNSKPTTRNNVADNIMVQRALEQQRRMYEERYSELIDNQIRINEQNNRLNQNRINRNNVPNSDITTTSTLYPNLPTMGYNHLQTAVNISPNINHSSAPVIRTHFNTGMFVEILARPAPKEAVTPFRLSSADTISPSAPLTPSNNMHNEEITYNGARPKTRINRNNVPNSDITTTSTLYPNLPTMGYNHLQTAVNISPNINHSSAPVIRTQLSSADTISPSAPLTPSNNMHNEEITYNGARPKTRQPAKVANIRVGVECVTCKSDFGIHIYQCPDGHSSCNDCRSLFKKCGICSKFITDMRNITLEGTIADMNIKTNSNDRIKCHNAKDGCSLSFTKSEMKNHLLECPFKDLECPLTSIFKNCSWHGKINQMVNHFKDMHPQHCVADVDKEMNLTLKRDERTVYLVNIGSYNFLINIQVKLNEKMIYIVTQLFGTKVSASKWTYELHIYNKRAPRRKFQYIDKCHSNVTSVEEIFNKAQCAALNIAYAKTFVNNGCLTYKFFLKKNFGPKN